MIDGSIIDKIAQEEPVVEQINEIEKDNKQKLDGEIESGLIVSEVIEESVLEKTILIEPVVELTKVEKYEKQSKVEETKIQLISSEVIKELIVDKTVQKEPLVELNSEVYKKQNIDKETNIELIDSEVIEESVVDKTAPKEPLVELNEKQNVDEETNIELIDSEAIEDNRQLLDKLASEVIKDEETKIEFIEKPIAVKTDLEEPVAELTTELEKDENLNADEETNIDLIKLAASEKLVVDMISEKEPRVEEPIEKKLLLQGTKNDSLDAESMKRITLEKNEPLVKNFTEKQLFVEHVAKKENNLIENIVVDKTTEQLIFKKQTETQLTVEVQKSEKETVEIKTKVEKELIVESIRAQSIKTTDNLKAIENDPVIQKTVVKTNDEESVTTYESLNNEQPKISNHIPVEKLQIGNGVTKEATQTVTNCGENIDVLTNGDKIQVDEIDHDVLLVENLLDTVKNDIESMLDKQAKNESLQFIPNNEKIDVKSSDPTEEFETNHRI